MKMVILIVKDNDADEITQALTSEKYRVTRVASTGGFLRSGVVTFLIGMRDERDPAGLRETAQPRRDGRLGARVVDHDDLARHAVRGREDALHACPGLGLALVDGDDDVDESRHGRGLLHPPRVKLRS